MSLLLKPLGFHCLSFEPLKTSGCINIIYNLKATSAIESNQPSDIEFILKVSNPHRYWKHCGTQNEIYTMQYMFEQTTIPIPKVFAYSYDSNSSILGCEFILMEKIQGNTLESVIGTMPDEILAKTIAETVDYIRQLRAIHLPQMNQMGSFCSKTMTLGGLLHDGPHLGPFETIRGFILANLRWSIQRIQTDPELYESGNYLLIPLDQIIESLEKNERLVNTKPIYHITHTDLNPSNIIVNEETGKILAILDWESTAVTFDDSDMKFYEAWSADKQQQAKMKLVVLSVWSISESNDIDPMKPYLYIMYPAMWATFYSCTWFDDEQTVAEHIKHFLSETEKAIAVFKDISP